MSKSQTTASLGEIDAPDPSVICQLVGFYQITDQTETIQALATQPHLQRRPSPAHAASSVAQ